jgi:molybdopterin-guanine dinucleotide biosynthesis protein A
MTGALPPYDAVVLTGGRSSRLGGLHKPGVALGGRAMAARVLDAVRDADRRIVVGPSVRERIVDLVTREEPPGGGPVAGLAAGLVGVLAPVVATLGGDLPFLDAAAVLELRTALETDPTAALVLFADDDGRDQPLCAVWATEALRVALAGVGGPAGVPLHRLVEAAPGTVARRRAHRDGPPPWFDCDTDQDLTTARGWLE